MYTHWAAVIYNFKLPKSNTIYNTCVKFNILVVRLFGVVYIMSLGFIVLYYLHLLL